MSCFSFPGAEACAHIYRVEVLFSSWVHPLPVGRFPLPGWTSPAAGHPREPLPLLSAKGTLGDAFLLLPATY